MRNSSPRMLSLVLMLLIPSCALPAPSSAARTPGPYTPSCVDCDGDARRAPRHGGESARGPLTRRETAVDTVTQSIRNGGDADSDEADDAIFYYGR